MDHSYRFILDLAIILISTKALGLIVKKLGLPQVVGFLLAGILVGPMLLGWVLPVAPGKSDPIKYISDIGVILILFSAGMSTNLKEMKKNGKASILITLLGVIVPIGMGFLLALVFFNKGFSNLANVSKDILIESFFYGIVLTATSVGITVETLHEMGRLKGKVGASILGAAVIDDIIGVVLLTVLIGMKSSTVGIGKTMLNVLYFVLAAAGIGIVLHFIFNFIGKHYDNRRRLPIFSLAICFFFAWASEELFHISGITGAYVAGAFISNLKGTDYVEKRINIITYMVFGPVFFARIGIATSIQNFSINVLIFTILFVIVGIISKLIGGAVAARVFKYSKAESVAVGFGMVARGEVALVVAAKGLELGIMQGEYMPAIMILVIVSSFVVPIALKMTYKRIPENLECMQANNNATDNLLSYGEISTKGSKGNINSIQQYNNIGLVDHSTENIVDLSDSK